MNFRWEELLDLANEWFQEAQQTRGQRRQALLRCAASRAYYAAFGVAAEWLRAHYPRYQLPSHGEIHQVVADFFRFHQEPPHREVGRLLLDLRLVRNQADYHPAIPDLLKATQRNLFNANRVLNTLAGLEG